VALSSFSSWTGCSRTFRCGWCLLLGQSVSAPSTAEGGWRVNPLDGWVLIIGLSTAVATTVLGVFGKRVGRVSLVIFGVLLFLFNYVGWLGNHR